MEVIINGTAYKIRYTLRALFIFENITGKSFNVESSMEQFLFYYAILLANNPGMTMTFDDFIDACEPDAEGSDTIIKTFGDLLSAQEKKMAIMKGDGDDAVADGEKKS
jgi:hypothetical protein